MAKPRTRSANKKTELRPSQLILQPGASPVLTPTARKRKSTSDHIEEPVPKKMAEAQLLEAINGIKKSVGAMEQQMKNVPCKADLGVLVNEIRGVKETVIRNTDRIDTLFDLRKNDGRTIGTKG